jgi:hypothetical protein
MLEALHAVEYELPSFDTQLHDVDLAAVARARVEIRHVRGASDATYLINAFGEELLTDILRIPGLLDLIFRRWGVRGNEIRSQPTRRQPKRQDARPHWAETRCFVFIKAYLCRRRLSHLTSSPGHAGAGGARSWAINIRISWNICRGTATSAI